MYYKGEQGADMPSRGGKGHIPTSEELQQILRSWLESKGDPKCAVCAQRWTASITQDNVALQSVPNTRNTLSLLRWGNPDTRAQRQSMASRLRSLGQTLWALHTGSTKAVKITCDQCGNMVFFDAYKIGAMERPENPY
jgi:hypothetical protein